MRHLGTVISILNFSSHLDHHLGVTFDNYRNPTIFIHHFQSLQETFYLGRIVGFPAYAPKPKAQHASSAIPDDAPITCWSLVALRCTIKVELEKPLGRRIPVLCTFHRLG